MRTIKYILKPARSAFALALADVLDKVVKGPSDGEAWQDLLSFGSNFLRVSESGSKRRNLTSVQLKRLKAGSNPSDDAPGHTPSLRPRNSEAIRAVAITAKLEEDNISAAVRMLCSEDTPAVFSIANLAKLQAKHPPEHADARPLQNSADKPPLQVSAEAVLQVIRSLPAGSARGPDGFKPQPLADLVQSQESGKFILTSVTSFVNSLLEGKCHKDFVHILFGGRLLAMDKKKKSGGISPIVVSYVWRRLVAKCTSAHAINTLADDFTPIKLSVGVPGGCQAAVHATRRFLYNMPIDYIIAKLDFSNIFNCLHSDAILERANEIIPELSKFCHLAYSQYSTLLFGGYSLSSQQDPQQGYPLKGRLFCLAIQANLPLSFVPIYSRFHGRCHPWWLQIYCLYGRLSFRIEGAKLDLNLNVSKYEVLSRDQQSFEGPMKGFTRISPSDAVFRVHPRPRHRP